MELFLKKDDSAIARTAEKYGGRLRAVALRITGDYSVAEECENDTYMEAWRIIPPNEPRTYLPAFLYRITRNIAVNRCEQRDRLKRKALLTELSEEMEQCIPSPDDVESRIEGAELAGILSGYLSKQPKEKRVIFMQRYFYFDSVADIAKRYGCSESRIKTMLFRMRGDIREYLIKEGYVL